MIKKLIASCILLVLTVSTQAQTIKQARFSISHRANGFQSIDLVIDDGIFISLTGNGRIEYIESEAGEVYGLSDMEMLGLPVDFYDEFDINDIPGRIKSIGGIQIKYNNVFDIHERRGTLKSIGGIDIKYYNTFDINEPQGRVKSVGNVDIKYYNKFDPAYLFGRIKSIDGSTPQVSVAIASGWPEWY